LVLGLLPDQDPKVYQEQIRRRVLARIKGGALQETQGLLGKYSQDLPSLTAIGYRSIIAHLQGDLSQEAMINAWVQDEYHYAKRQLLFFRKLPHVSWYDSGQSDLQEVVENQVKTWYDSR
jgi:tRNA dimethylallyltransferase